MFLHGVLRFCTACYCSTIAECLVQLGIFRNDKNLYNAGMDLWTSTFDANFKWGSGYYREWELAQPNITTLGQVYALPAPNATANGTRPGNGTVPGGPSGVTVNGTAPGNGSISGNATAIGGGVPGNGTRPANGTVTGGGGVASNGTRPANGTAGGAGVNGTITGGEGTATTAAGGSTAPIAVILLPAPSEEGTAPSSLDQGGAAAVPLPVTNSTAAAAAADPLKQTPPGAAGAPAPAAAAPPKLAVEPDDDDLGLFQEGDEGIPPPDVLGRRPTPVLASLPDGGGPADQDSGSSNGGDAAVASSEYESDIDYSEEVVTDVTTTVTETTTDVTTIYSDGTESTTSETVEGDPANSDFQTASGSDDRILVSTEGFVGQGQLEKGRRARNVGTGRRLSGKGAEKYGTGLLRMHAAAIDAPPLLTGVVAASVDKPRIAAAASKTTTAAIDDDLDHEEDEGYDDGLDDDNAFEVAAASNGAAMLPPGGSKVVGGWDSSWSTTARWYGSSSTGGYPSTTPAVFATYTGGSSLWPTTGSTSSSSNSGKTGSSTSSRSSGSGANVRSGTVNNLVPNWGVSEGFWAEDRQGGRPAAPVPAPARAATIATTTSSTKGSSSSSGSGVSSSSISSSSKQANGGLDFWEDPSLWSATPVSGTTSKSSTKPATPVKTPPVPAPSPAPTAAAAVPPGGASNTRNSRPSPTAASTVMAAQQAPAKAPSSTSRSNNINMGDVPLDDLWNDPTLWNATPLPMRGNSRNSGSGRASVGAPGGGVAFQEAPVSQQATTKASISTSSSTGGSNAAKANAEPPFADLWNDPTLWNATTLPLRSNSKPGSGAADQSMSGAADFRSTSNNVADPAAMTLDAPLVVPAMAPITTSPGSSSSSNSGNAVSAASGTGSVVVIPTSPDGERIKLTTPGAPNMGGSTRNPAGSVVVIPTSPEGESITLTAPSAANAAAITGISGSAASGPNAGNVVVVPTSPNAQGVTVTPPISADAAGGSSNGRASGVVGGSNVDNIAVPGSAPAINITLVDLQLFPDTVNSSSSGSNSTDVALAAGSSNSTVGSLASAEVTGNGSSNIIDSSSSSSSTVDGVPGENLMPSNISDAAAPNAGNAAPANADAAASTAANVANAASMDGGSMALSSSSNSSRTVPVDVLLDAMDLNSTASGAGTAPNVRRPGGQPVAYATTRSNTSSWAQNTAGATVPTPTPWDSTTTSVWLTNPTAKTVYTNPSITAVSLTNPADTAVDKPWTIKDAAITKTLDVPKMRQAVAARPAFVIVDDSPVNGTGNVTISGQNVTMGGNMSLPAGGNVTIGNLTLRMSNMSSNGTADFKTIRVGNVTFRFNQGDLPFLQLGEDPASIMRARGEVTETLRDMFHSQFFLGGMVQVAEIAWQQVRPLGGTGMERRGFMLILLIP